MLHIIFCGHVSLAVVAAVAANLSVAVLCLLSQEQDSVRSTSANWRATKNKMLDIWLPPHIYLNIAVGEKINSCTVATSILYICSILFFYSCQLPFWFCCERYQILLLLLKNVWFAKATRLMISVTFLPGSCVCDISLCPLIIQLLATRRYHLEWNPDKHQSFLRSRIPFKRNQELRLICEALQKTETCASYKLSAEHWLMKCQNMRQQVLLLKGWGLTYCNWWQDGFLHVLQQSLFFSAGVFYLYLALRANIGLVFLSVEVQNVPEDVVAFPSKPSILYHMAEYWQDTCCYWWACDILRAHGDSCAQLSQKGIIDRCETSSLLSRQSSFQSNL